MSNEPGSSFANPIVYRGEWLIYYMTTCDLYGYEHKDYDGCPFPPQDKRVGNAETVEECKAEIEERYYADAI